MAWLYQHADVISALASSGMLVVWSVYASLFYQEVRRQRGSQFFIHEAGGEELNSVCLLVNLSKEPVHVLCSLAARDDLVLRLRDTTEAYGSDPIYNSKQGPLGNGQSMILGSFEAICRELGVSEADGDCSEFEVRVAAIHGFREWPVGARRRFRVDHSERQLWPVQGNTEQLHSRRQSREIRGWLESCRDRSRHAAVGDGRPVRR